MRTRMRRRAIFFLPVMVLLIAACVPADEALGLGSVEFTFSVSQRTRDGVIADESADRYAIKFNRVILSFKTMTIGKVGVSDTCAYRGRGAITNVVFNPLLEPIVQTFNGIKPIDCPDVGVIFGAPDSATGLGPKVPASDLIELAEGAPAQAIVEATATRRISSRPGTVTEDVQKIHLRFDATITSSRFGGCRSSTRGVRILANQRELVTVRFAAEAFFRDAISQEAKLRSRPYIDADSFAGNNDGITTMDEVDAYPLSSVNYSEFYQMPDGTRFNRTFGDYIRALYRFSIFFRNEEGVCVGNEPGVDESAILDAGRD
jgi:hypothetical protein